MMNNFNNLPATMSITLAACLMIVSSVASGQEGFWQSPHSATNSNQADYSLRHENDISASLTTSSYSDFNGRTTAQSAVSITQNFSESSAFTLEYAHAGEQRNAVLGFTHNNISVSYMTGSGEDYADLRGEYVGIDPYLFHGGYKQDFRTEGYALDYAVRGVGHLQFGQATVRANGLQDRRARYFEWSNARMFARATEFARGAERIGSGLDVGFAIDQNKLLAVQAMQLDNDRSMQRLRFQLNGRDSRQYWIDLSAHQNALYRANDDYRIMFNFKTLLGSKHLASYQNDEVSDSETAEEDAIEDESGTPASKKTKGKGWKRAVFIGGGIAAAAALSSSGSSAQDANIRFRNQTEAAFDVLNRINPVSISENREYGGWVFRNPDGSFASTAPVRGEAASVTLPARSVIIPLGSMATASYHTHAAFDPRFDNENFSPQDLASDRAAMVDGFLATPGGQFKFHDFETGAITTLGRIATE